MHFYVDESGNTGLHLFDTQQPALFYGLLSSPHNLDEVLEPEILRLRNRFNVERLHASELGIGQITEMVNDISILIDQFEIKFDFYRLLKQDYAIIQFFDQVFDQGLNPAVGWHWYWTPLRYPLLLKLASLFDYDLIVLSWSARIDRDNNSSDSKLIEVCKILLSRAESLPDARSQQLIRDALIWAINNPRDIEYNTNRRNMQLAISPNLIGFQFVLMGIALRLRNVGRNASKITVDQQQQFNRAQGTLADFYARGSGQVLPLGPGLPELDLRQMPTDALHFSSSHQSAGLELVDILLWLFSRKHTGITFNASTERLLENLFHQGMQDELSLHAIESRWAPLLLEIPELTEEESIRASEILQLAERRRLEAIAMHGRAPASASGQTDS